MFFGLQTLLPNVAANAFNATAVDLEKLQPNYKMQYYYGFRFPDS